MTLTFFRGRIKVMSTIALHSTFSCTVRDSGSKGPPMAYGESDDVTRPWKVKLVIPIRL